MLTLQIYRGTEATCGDCACFNNEPTSALNRKKTGGAGFCERTYDDIFVTHEMVLVREVANKVVIMDGGEIIEARMADQTSLKP